jgi:hypothetical protein
MAAAARAGEKAPTGIEPCMGSCTMRSLQREAAMGIAGKPVHRSEDNHSGREGENDVTNAELAGYVGESLNIFCHELVAMRKQQERLEARIAFIAPTESDIVREVDEFIESIGGIS